MKWIRLSKYCELSGDTAYAVRHRRSRGIWVDGVHVTVAADRKLWVNIDEVDRWVEQSKNVSLNHQTISSQVRLNN